MPQPDFIRQVHERTIESDFLLIVLKSLLAQRSDLKYVILADGLNCDLNTMLSSVESY